MSETQPDGGGTDGTGPDRVRVVTLSGTLHSPSTTDTLLEAIVDELARRAPVTVHRIRVLELRQEIIDSLSGGPTPVLAEQDELLRNADLIVVGTPVYKGSYTGLLKLFLDLLGQDDLVGAPVLLAALGGSAQHSLVIDQELRPLFAFFRAHTIPEGVYAEGRDLTDGTLSEPIRDRIARAAEQALGIAGARLASRPHTAADPLTRPRGPGRS